MHLNARTGSRKPKKEVQNIPKHESTFGAQDYHSALLECRMALFWALAQFPLSVDKAHLFQPFRKRRRPDSHFNCPSLFFTVF